MGKRLAIAIALIVVAGAVAVSLVLVRRPHETAPNVILITVDTLRRDHLGCYGYQRPTSPSIDAFAQDALVFDNGYSHASTTRPSVATILTGLYPHECMVFINSDMLSSVLNTAAEYLRAAGYRTLGVSSNFVLDPNSGFEQGFDVFNNDLPEMEMVRGVPERIADETTDAAIDLLKSNGRAKFFLWVHYQDPHGPYTPPAPYDTLFIDRSLPPRRIAFNMSVSGEGGIPDYQRIDSDNDYNFYVAKYDGEIRYLDEHVGRLFEALKDMGLYDRSLIIFTADHGEGMGEHDYYFAHGENLYNSLLRVPLIVRFGQSTPRGRHEQYAGLADVLPTILAATGIQAAGPLRGSDLLSPALQSMDIYSEMEGKYSLIKAGIKVIADAEVERAYLFDLTNDPDEEHDVIGNPAYAAYLHPLAAELDSCMMTSLVGQNVERAPANLTEEEKAKLRSLGYVH